ncbi:HAMP domain-containing sensor histidine kinase [Chitinophaga sp. MM2321]|uniref:sensor histidine kinase n=1 Tax=Chitinophaga sp. MM2321 TaxID=3137178 RepID=UPI0032D58EF7
MSKLLNKSMKAFIMYAGIVLACSIPAYYAIIDFIWEHELKEHNLIVSEATKQNLHSLSLSDTELTESILLWNKLRPETQLQMVPALKPDSIYNTYRKNKYIPAKGWDRFQGLITYFTINGKVLRLTLETNMEESHETIIAIAAVTFIFFLILLGGLIFINRKISEKLWRPFYNSLQKIQSFDLHKQYAIHFEKSGIEEFETLNYHLDKLIAGNIRVYKQQKEFTQNASHELQTPLAIIKFKLDLLHQSKPITGEQSEIIDQAHQALTKVSRINKNLLLLAKMENSQFSEKEPVNLSALIQNYYPLLEDFVEDKQLQVVLQIQPDIKLSGNKVLVEILLTNLFLNAIRHSTQQGSICIRLTENILEVSNKGMAPLDEKMIFRRFGPSSPNTTGTGLGLAIIKQICHLHGWQESYRFEQNHHIFKIEWT